MNIFDNTIYFLMVAFNIMKNSFLESPVLFTILFIWFTGIAINILRNYERTTLECFVWFIPIKLLRENKVLK